MELGGNMGFLITACLMNRDVTPHGFCYGKDGNATEEREQWATFDTFEEAKDFAAEHGIQIAVGRCEIIPVS